MWMIDKIKALFNKFVKIFKELFDEAFPIVKQIIMGQLSQFASQAVGELNVSTLNNDQKRTEAFKRIQDYAKTNAIEAKDSLINVLIEIAVQRLKNV